MEADDKRKRVAEGALDFFSPSFDPVAALASDSLLPPLPRAPALDNLSRCRALLPAGHPDAPAGALAAAPSAEEERARAAERERERVRKKAERAAERAANEQRREEKRAARGPAVARFTSAFRVPKPNARAPGGAAGQGGFVRAGFVAAAAPAPAEGPLALLKRLFARGCRVRVMVLGARGVRGTVAGRLLAFDKHVNVVLADAEETFLRREWRRDKSGGGAEKREVTALRTRRMSRVLLRGDSVVALCEEPAAGRQKPRQLSSR